MDFNLDDFEIDDITPKKKKKRKANSGQKGKRAERILCKVLTKRFGKEFSRTIGSGNRWSQVKEMPQHAKDTFTGDICAPEGFLYSLECKNGYEDKIDLGKIFTSRNKTLDGFLKQSIKEAKDCNRLPAICWKRQRKPWVVFVKEKDLKDKKNFPARLIYHGWVCIDLDQWLEQEDSVFFGGDK